MARIPWSLIVGLVIPLILIVVNLVWTLGGILILILLLLWLGLGVIFVTPEDRGTA